MKTMKALVKKEAREGLWLDEVPVPEIGINDVLIQILRTGICGTDVHIYNWDAWSQKTIPVPMVVGHEFVGRIVEVGSNVKDFRVGDIVSGEGHVVCGRCRNCLAGRRHLCKETNGVGVNRPGAFAEYPFAADDERLASRSGRVARRGRDLRSVRQRRAYRAVVSRARRGRADHRRGSDRHHGRGRGAPCRRAVRRHHRRESLPPRTGQEDEAHARARRQPRERLPTCRRSSA